MDYVGEECVPAQVSLIEAYTHDRSRVAVLQRHDGLGPHPDIYEPAVSAVPSTDEIEALLAEAPIFRSPPRDTLHDLATGGRPLLLGPTQRFVIEGQPGTSLFLVGEGEVEVRLHRDDGRDWLAATMGRGEIVGEMALVTGECRAATVRWADETVIYEISRQLYEPLLRAHPEWLDELRRGDGRPAGPPTGPSAVLAAAHPPCLVRLRPLIRPYGTVARSRQAEYARTTDLRPFGAAPLRFIRPYRSRRLTADYARRSARRGLADRRHARPRNARFVLRVRWDARSSRHEGETWSVGLAYRRSGRPHRC